jgi:hypothetical protein
MHLAAKHGHVGVVRALLKVRSHGPHHGLPCVRARDSRP